jgi:hypothetical protein
MNRKLQDSIGLAILCQVLEYLECPEYLEYLGRLGYLEYLG